MNLGLYLPTDWRIVTSGGAEVDFGLSRVFFIGLAGGAFYVRQGRGAIQRLPFFSLVGGVGLTASAGVLVTVSGSFPFQPGGGWRIYRNRIRRDSLTLRDLTGGCFCVSRVLALGVSGSLTLAFFGIPWIARHLEGPLSVTLPWAALSANAAGILWGTGETISAGYSGSTAIGIAHFPSPAADGETGSFAVDEYLTDI
jgi:hypothetical protein